jgi:hypothetical protein
MPHVIANARDGDAFVFHAALATTEKRLDPGSTREGVLMLRHRGDP